MKLDRLPLVFAGYGLAVPDLGYDDYARVDVSGKAVLIFTHEPQEHEAGSRLNGTRPMPQTSLNAKAQLALSKGARAVFAVSDPSHRNDEGQYSLFTSDPDADDQGIPVLRVRRSEIQPLLDAFRLDAAARLIDMDLVPRSEVLNTATLDYVESLTRNRKTVRNVVGILPGSDPARAGEAIVIGAHYDHVGLGGRLSGTPDRTGEIHNGADDNASGTASIIEIARAAADQRSRFPRTLVFVAFAGEEKGLLGSAYYASHSVFPIDNTVAMLNLDMVGRARGEVDVSGLEASPSMEADLKAATSAAGGGLQIKRAGPRRRSQRRRQLHRSPHSGHQLLYRVSSRLPSADRRLGKDRCGGNQAGRNARAGARGPPGRTDDPARIRQALKAGVEWWSESPLLNTSRRSRSISRPRCRRDFSV